MNGFFYGGDYNPDQWPQETMKEDFHIFHEAGVNILTLPVFSWSLFQSSPDEYHFEWFDAIVDAIIDEGFSICMATSTAVQPAWMSKKFPEMLPVDFQGRKRKFGGRVKFCPNNETYRHYSAELAKRFATRYGHHKELVLWHVANEYDNWCYCPHCEEQFRIWLKVKYRSLDELNRAWYSNFWGHHFYDWDEIVAPSGLSEMWLDNGRLRSNFQAISLDYARFMNESVLGCYRNEKAVLNEITPHIPVTTNFMGFFKPLNYFSWAPHLDIISWDSYPGISDSPSRVAMSHDLMRSLKKEAAFMLMEQTPSQQNWQPYNSLKPPGLLRLQSWQAIGHGASSVMYFQMRRSRGACEKHHSALIDHAGRTDTRVFRECAQLGHELAGFDGDLASSIIKPEVGIIFDWENWWSLEYSSGPSTELDYITQIQRWYDALHACNIPVDFVHPGEDLSAYKLLFAPCLYMLSLTDAGNLADAVRGGATLVGGFLSGIVDEYDLVHPGGYPGPLKEVFGLWVEEYDVLPPGVQNQAVFEAGPQQGNFGCSIICDIVRPETAKALAHYDSAFYRGTAVITENAFGRGRAIYCGTALDEKGTTFVLERAVTSLSPMPWSRWPVPQGVEISMRESNTRRWIIVLNHNQEQVQFDIALQADVYPADCLSGSTLTLEPQGLAVFNLGLSGK